MFIAIEQNGNPKADTKINPLKFMMWTAIVSIIMMFAGLTSAYIVRQAEGNWLKLDIPTMFWFSSIAILISSGTFHMAIKAAKRNAYFRLNSFLIGTISLGIIFVICQFVAWKELYNSGIYLTGNSSGSFLFVITGLHAFHVLGGMFFLFLVLIMALQKKYHAFNLLHLELCATYWHFVGGLWIYLFLFLSYSHLTK